MRLLNLGILAHVDAGKTSLTERLLHSVGVIDELGSVDAGSTRTDTLALERQRGITIKSAVVSFQVDDVTVNLIDTPGHPDFIAEVERVLGVLDGAVLVVSAVEGVQAQTLVLMRALQRLGIATVVFVNKVDRSGADPDFVELEVRERLDADVPVLVGSALRGQGVLRAMDYEQPRMVVPEPDCAGRPELLHRALTGWAGAIGPPVPLADAAKSLRWAEAAACERIWELPEGLSVVGSPPRQFALRVQRQSTDGYAVRLVWDRTQLNWPALARLELLGSCLASLLSSLGLDLWSLLEQPVSGLRLRPRAA